MPSDTIRSITIRGFKSIASATVELRPINILIGANGSGKSNFIGAFAFLREIGAGRLREYVAKAGGAEKVLHFGSKKTEKISLRVTLAPGEVFASFDLTLGPTLDDVLFISEQLMQVGGNLIDVSDIGIDSPACQPPLYVWARNRLERWRPYHLHDTSAMRKTARADDNRFLRPDGSNLPAFLYYLHKKHREAYMSIVLTVRQMSPFFGDFDLTPRNLNPEDIILEWRHLGSDQLFGASSLSDGTLRFIALATLFLQPHEHRGSMILVDEPELGLHPYAIELLAALIRQAAVDTQVIVSTQSSLLLDHFEPKDILVADRVNGGTQLTRPDSARLEKWLEDYSLGQLWEKNEIGGRPAPG